MEENIKKILEKAKNSPWAFFINRRAISWLFLIAILAFGTMSWMSLPRELQPEISFPYVGVTTTLPGASPSDTESLLTKPIESKVANLSDVKLITSSSGFGYSSVFVEFEASADIDTSLQEMKDAVDIAKRELPEDASDPIVSRIEANAFSIITFSVISNRPLYETTNIAKDVQDELEKINGVSRVDIIGGLSKEINVIVDKNRAENYGIDIQTISSMIKGANSNMPIGLISTDKLNYSVRIDNRYSSIEDIRKIPITTIPQANNTTILLKDIAEVKEIYPEKNVISKISSDGMQSQETVSLQLFKKDNTDLVKIATEAKTRVEELKTDGSIPHNADIIISTDNSFWVENDLGVLTRNGGQTTLIIIFFLFLALGLRQGIIAGLSIPIIFMIAFIIMSITGMTLNSLSVFSLVIALGLMVDTTIVIMEGIHENLNKGFSPKDSATLSVYTYKWPIIAGTMTTVFAFFPMLLVSGILGQFLRTLPITISAALLGSLVVSLTIAPSIATKFVKRNPKKKHSSILEPLFKKLGEKFIKLIEYILSKTKRGILVILLTLVLFAASMALPITGILPVQMFPQTDQNYFIVRIETPQGTILEETINVAEEIEQYINKMTVLENYLTNIGTSTSGGITENDQMGGSSGATTNSNIANITINLIDKEERNIKSYVIAQNLRDEFKNYKNAKITVEEISDGPPSEAPINLKLSGKDFDKMQIIAEDLQIMIEETPGTTNAEISKTPGLNEFKFTLNRDILAFHGLSSIQVAGQIRNIVQGIEADTVTFGDDELDIFVKYDLPKSGNRTNLSISYIEGLEIQTPKGYSVTLGEIGQYSFQQSVSTISREDEKRTIKISGEMKKGFSIADITEQIEKKVAAYDLPRGYVISFGGDLEEINESFRDLFRSMGVAVLLIACTLILMFNSFRQATLILITLPLALIGVFPGLLIIGLDLSFPAFLGVVALAGIVVNDAIVLIDRINTNRKHGIEFTKSISEAASARMQPIMMTSITTIVGILPLALTEEFWAGLGFSLIFGLLFSTGLTLIIIPILYYLFEIRKARKKGEQVA